MQIQKNHSVPIYTQLKEIIQVQIDQGVYHSGDMIPSERMLSEIYDISRMTARQAINELVKEGKLYREKGRGTFVSAPKFLQQNIKSFTETLRDEGYTPSARILEFDTVRQLNHITQWLDLPQESVYYKLKRLRLADATPVALETVYIPQVYCPDLQNYDVTTSLYEILKEKYDYTIESISCKIEALISDKVMMEKFDVKKMIPLLKVEGINRETQGKKLFYEISYYRSDLYNYQVDLQKREIGKR